MSQLYNSRDLPCIELPMPTPWPMISAFAVVLLFTGLVTSWVVSFMGLICATIAFSGWFLEVFPYPKHDIVPLKPIEEWPTPIRVAGRSLSYLKKGQGGHRVHIPLHVHTYSSGILGGIAGGGAMALVALIFGFLEGSVWYPINLVAAAGLPNFGTAGKEVLMQFHPLAFLVGIVVHTSFSILIGLLYVVFLPTLPAKFEWLYGGIVVPLIWSSLIYAFLSMVNPALALYVSWPWFILSQVIFGLVVGTVVYRSTKIDTMQAWSFADKMGIEGIRKEE